MAELKAWDKAAANNNDPSPDGAPEGMAPSGVNDVIRENMAVLARWKGDNDGTLDSGGSSNAYTLTPNGTYSAYSRGDTFKFEANHTNTGSATLDVSSLGVKTIKHVSGATLSANQILSGGVYQVVYDGTDFLLQNPSLVDASGFAAAPLLYTSTGTFTVAAAGTTTQVITLAPGTYWVSAFVYGTQMVTRVTAIAHVETNLVSGVTELQNNDYVVGTGAIQPKGGTSGQYTFDVSRSGAIQFVFTGDTVAPNTATYRIIKLAEGQ